MLDTRPHVVEDAISDLAIGGTDLKGVSPFGCMAHLVVAGEFVAPESAAFIVRHTSGFMRMPAAAGICRNLQLPLMVRNNENRQNCVHSHGGRRSRVGTGIGARDRSLTTRVLADPAASPEGLTRPGHLPPRRAQPFGRLARRGYTEAAIDLLPAAGLRPVAAMSELVGMRYPRSMPDSHEGTEFGHAHRLTVVDLRDRIAFRRTATTAPVESAQARGRAGVAR
jgi:3,4-dihydroxy 2-butanone 4-phosphate synthase / GTP cyclohydrolase II